MNKKEAYEQKIDAQLREWEAQIELLKAKATKTDAQMRVKAYETLDDLEQKKTDVRSKLNELKQASGENWEAFVEKVDAAWRDLKTGITRATEHFK